MKYNKWSHRRPKQPPLGPHPIPTVTRVVESTPVVEEKQANSEPKNLDIDKLTDYK